MPKKAATKTTDQYIHTSSRRLNLPTEQTSKTMSDADRRPVLHLPETREIDDDPILAWNRQRHAHSAAFSDPSLLSSAPTEARPGSPTAKSDIFWWPYPPKTAFLYPPRSEDAGHVPLWQDAQDTVGV